MSHLPEIFPSVRHFLMMACSPGMKAGHANKPRVELITNSRSETLPMCFQDLEGDSSEAWLDDSHPHGIYSKPSASSYLSHTPSSELLRLELSQGLIWCIIIHSCMTRVNVSPLTMDTKIFKLLLQGRHLGADRATAVQELLVIQPHATKRNVPLEPHDSFVVILQDESEERKHPLHHLPVTNPGSWNPTDDGSAAHFSNLAAFPIERPTADLIPKHIFDKQDAAIKSEHEFVKQFNVLQQVIIGVAVHRGDTMSKYNNSTFFRGITQWGLLGSTHSMVPEPCSMTKPGEQVKLTVVPS
ncbi:hypothetical protein EYF80_006446 [Liparis tanakae]|uniref:Uncharacterized protein n=1 Tax=Liparis tanakae TaxID=230148 RepID=A0A4Z2IZK6_9TELE|nr:hypothetical protein EYF80_006446 [Liparis tanakae]